MYYSSEVVKQFITDSLNRSMDDLAIQLEAYVMSGLKGTCKHVTTVYSLTLSFPPGVIINSKTRILELKRKTTTLILEKLRRYIPYIEAPLLNMTFIGTLTGAAITRMAYDRFNELITEKYHVVVRNWPLKQFCNPSAITSRIELQLLYNAWESGVTYFQKLTPEEMEVWENNRFSSCMESMGPPANLIPALASPQTPAAEMTLLSELPHQDHLEPAPVLSPNPLQNIPLVPITNLTTEWTPTTTSCPPAPTRNIIAAMIHADPTLQNVDPTLIAMGIAGSNQRPVETMTANTTPPVERPPNHTPPAGSSKRRWQEVITPLSYDARAAKKTRKQKKDKRLQVPPAV